MLKELRIQNLILVESASLTFRSGLNVLSGETGSGKSAVISALSLLLGSRADSGLVRRDCEKGSAEARFILPQNETLLSLLEESGIEADEELIVRREISAQGKSRAWVNHQMVQLTLLRKIGDALVDMVGQHANQRLMSSEQHREILDLFGDLQPDREAFAKSWKLSRELARELESLKSKEAQRLREMEVCRMEIEELESANLQEGEEEDYFAEYSRLTNAEELAEKLHHVQQALDCLSTLSSQQSTLDKLAQLDPELSDATEAYRNAIIELQEIENTLGRYQGRIEQNPSRMEEVNARLTLLNKLKKKYGRDVAEIQQYLEDAKQRLFDLEHHDEKIAETQKQLSAQEKENDALCHTLTQKRKKAASKLEKAIVAELAQLNMSKVEFEAKFSPQTRNAFGDDHVEFYLRPNVGEAKISIRECASGGELSRILLALQTVLTGKEKTPTLIFDEVDANIGGETAAMVGEKLRAIGKQHQVLCITHFPQVAKQAEHHIRISKTENDGRTLTLIEELSEQERAEELRRMKGEKVLVTH